MRGWGRSPSIITLSHFPCIPHRLHLPLPPHPLPLSPLIPLTPLTPYPSHLLPLSPSPLIPLTSYPPYTSPLTSLQSPGHAKRPSGFHRQSAAQAAARQEREDKTGLLLSPHSSDYRAAWGPGESCRSHHPWDSLLLEVSPPGSCDLRAYSAYLRCGSCDLTEDHMRPDRYY